MENKKTPPRWGSVVGILGIIFGALGLMGGTYELMMPAMFEMQEKMMDSMKNIEKSEKKQRAEKPPCPDDYNFSTNSDMSSPFDIMKEMWKVPPWYMKWAYVNGSLALILGAAYILASIFLLIVRVGAPIMFISVAALSMLRNAMAIGIGLSAGSFMAYWSVSSAVAGLLIDLVLIIIVMVSDKSAYAKNTNNAI